MNAMILMAGLVLGGADSLAPTKLDGISLKAPTGWAAHDVDNGRNWEETTGAAQLEVNVWKVAPQRKAQDCVDQLVKGLATPGWEPLSIGGQPAVRKIVTDYLGGPDAGKTDANKVTTVTYVGCNGATKWLMSMSSPAAKAPRFGAVLKAIVGSIAYEK